MPEQRHKPKGRRPREPRHDEALRRFAGRVRELREQRELSHEEMMGRAGLHRTYAAQLEASRADDRAPLAPTLLNVLRLCDGLGITLEELVAGIYEPPDRP